MLGRGYVRDINIPHLRILQASYFGMPLKAILRDQDLDVSVRIGTCFFWDPPRACHTTTAMNA